VLTGWPWWELQGGLGVLTGWSGWELQGGLGGSYRLALVGRLQGGLGGEGGY
jgi:hypothetical protein